MLLPTKAAINWRLTEDKSEEGSTTTKLDSLLGPRYELHDSKIKHVTF